MAILKPTTYGVYVYDNSGGTLLASKEGYDSPYNIGLEYVTEGSVIDRLTASVDGLYFSYAASGYSLLLDMTDYAGLSRTPNATTPTILIGDDIDASEGLTFYVVDKASTAPIPSFSDVEVTPHDGYITMTINGVDFNLKTAASVSLISFSIDGAAQQAEDGMTWAEWVASDYNAGAFSSDGRNIRSNLSASYGRVVGVVVCGAVSLSDTITEDYNYVLYGEGSCD